ncbi:MAG: hypothetical protein R3C05_03575 [Pirellulaceae bacterium]
MNRKKSQSSSMLITLGGPAVLLCLYALHVRMNPSEAATQVARLEGELQSVKDAEVPYHRLTEAAERLRLKQEQLDVAKASLGDLRHHADAMMRGSVDAMEELALGQEVNRVLTAAGLRLVDGHPLESGSEDGRMLRTLTDAAKQLGQTLADQVSKEVDNTPVKRSVDSPPDANPLEWITEQKRSQTSRHDGPQTRSSQLKLIGDYRSMVAGLEAIVDTCPGVVVTSVAFEKPAVRGTGTMPLIWNLQYQVRSVTRIPAGALDMENVAEHESKSRLDESRSIDTEDGTKQGTYMVAKPIVRGSD